VVEGQLFDGTELERLASLPTREELMASIAGSIAAPISGIVGAVSALLRDIAYLVEEVARKRAESTQG
jgi:large subunit ribosomal protein L10